MANNQYMDFQFEVKAEVEEQETHELQEEQEYFFEKRTKKEYRQNKIKDKEDRATVEQCLDPKTRILLMKMLNKKFLREINGCVSTGKEANVYHGWDFEDKEYAIKIYKTSILVFKDRDKYISGEFRFRNGHCKSNPRKMVRLWAEKEYRNLKRIQQSNIPCPEPIQVKSNLIIMQFIGDDMKPAPRLKDATDVPYDEVYIQLVKSMRILHQECRLIHGDLSEYNLLYYKGKLYFIDVSQSMECDHPSSTEFLKRDIQNVSLYFKKKNVMIFTMRQLFKFITDESIIDANSEIEKMKEVLLNLDPLKEDEEDKVFVGAEQPTNLSHLPQKILEEELVNIKKHQSIARTIQDFQNADVKQMTKIEQQEEEDSNSNDDDDNDNDNDELDSDSDVSLLSEDDQESIHQDNEEIKEKKKGGLCKYDGLSKQDRKKQVKEENKEKRKNKLPKSMKKQMTKKKH